jgi:hypothetical protein
MERSVKAVIDSGSMKLAPDGARTGTWEFSLTAAPLAAIVTYEVLNADSLAPLEVILNDRPLGPAGPDSGAVAVRNLELQLKYNWKNLDYQLAPTTP